MRRFDVATFISRSGFLMDLDGNSSTGSGGFFLGPLPYRCNTKRRLLGDAVSFHGNAVMVRWVGEE